MPPPLSSPAGRLPISRHYLHHCHPLSSFERRHPYQRFFVVTSFLVGAFIGYISWIVGVLFLIVALRSAIRFIVYKNQWLNTLGYIIQNSRTYKGRVKEATRTVDPITHNVRYRAVLEYDDNDDDDNDNENDDSAERGNVKGGTTSTRIFSSRQQQEHFEAKWLYEYYLEQGDTAATTLDVKVLKGNGDNENSDGDSASTNDRLVLPSPLFLRKLKDAKLWAMYIDPAIAFVGIHVYIFGCITYVWITTTMNRYQNNNDMTFYILLTLSLLVAPILMLPYLMLEQQFHHDRRRKGLLLCLHSSTTTSLLSIEDYNSSSCHYYHWMTEFDFLKNTYHAVLGSTWSQHITSILFGVGILQMIFCTELASVPGFIAVYTLSQLYSEVPSPLEHYQNHYLDKDKALTVAGCIVRHEVVVEPDLIFNVAIRYNTTTRNDSNNNNNNNGEEGGKEDGEERSSSAVIVETEFQVPAKIHQLFLKTPNAIPMRVVKSHIRSGYPIELLVKAATRSWTMTGFQGACFLSGLLYLAMCWSIVIEDVFLSYYTDEYDLLGVMFVILIGPVLMIPHMSTLHRLRYKRLVEETIRNGTIVSTSTAATTTTMAATTR